MSFEEYATEYAELQAHYKKGWLTEADYLTDLIALNAAYLQGVAR